MMTLRSRTLLASLIAASFALTGCGDNQFEQEVKLEQSAVQLAQEAQQGGLSAADRGRAENPDGQGRGAGDHRHHAL